MKILITLMFLVSGVLIFNGCGGQADKKNGEEKQLTEQNTPKVSIHAAIVQGDLSTIRQHIKSGTDINQIDSVGGSTPLITAAVFNRIYIARTLIEAGADLNKQNNEGSTPLLTAAFFCREEIVKDLLKKGADKSIKNKRGSTALDVVKGSFDSVKPVYDHFVKALGPFGLKLDYDRLKETRPNIAEILK